MAITFIPRARIRTPEKLLGFNFCLNQSLLKSSSPRGLKSVVMRGLGVGRMPVLVPLLVLGLLNDGLLPPPLVLFCLASFTEIILPSKKMLSKLSIASNAWNLSAISTKPNPRDIPVRLSIRIFAETISPNSANSGRKLATVVCGLRFPIKRFISS